MIYTGKLMTIAFMTLAIGCVAFGCSQKKGSQMPSSPPEDIMGDFWEAVLDRDKARMKELFGVGTRDAAFFERWIEYELFLDEYKNKVNERYGDGAWAWLMYSDRPRGYIPMHISRDYYTKDKLLHEIRYEKHDGGFYVSGGPTELYLGLKGDSSGKWKLYIPDDKLSEYELSDRFMGRLMTFMRKDMRRMQNPDTKLEDLNKPPE